MLLLDEPFGALDATVRAELREWLRRLHDETQVTTLLPGGDRARAQLTRDQRDELELAAGDIVYVRATRVRPLVAVA